MALNDTYDCQTVDDDNEREKDDGKEDDKDSG